MKLRRGNYQKGTVPDGGIVLTGGVDVQKEYFFVTVRAWGAHQASRLIHEEQVQTWEKIEDRLIKGLY